jgi:hypothetical protein
MRCLAVVGYAWASVVQAAPTGSLALSSVTGGAISISATRIDFAPPVNALPGSAGRGDFASGAGTAIAWSGGFMTALVNPYGSIADIDVGAGPIVNFIQFYTAITLPTPPGNATSQTFPAFDLTGLVPGGAPQGALNNCAGVTAVGVACSPLITPSGGGSAFVSPLVLTNRGSFTTVAFGLVLSAKDANGNTAWNGGLTTRVTTQGATRLTPDAIQTLLNSGGTISSTYSATFASPPPAP